MSLRKGTSIFSRQFKKAFNDAKYQNLTAPHGETYSHLGWISNVDLRLGRAIFTFGMVGIAFCIYLEPSYFHETFGHMSQPPKYDLIDSNLSGAEKKLNKQILHREHNEHKLDSFVSMFKGSDVAKN
ncbi:hypothetical protein ABPG74_015124 [Tetrahymena malaccensis]